MPQTEQPEVLFTSDPDREYKNFDLAALPEDPRLSMRFFAFSLSALLRCNARSCACVQRAHMSYVHVRMSDCDFQRNPLRIRRAEEANTFVLALRVFSVQSACVQRTSSTLATSTREASQAILVRARAWTLIRFSFFR